MGRLLAFLPTDRLFTRKMETKHNHSPSLAPIDVKRIDLMGGLHSGNT